MKKIPSFQDFERNIDLNQKINPQLAESLSIWFSGDPRLNESKGFDAIKNFLSKTFLGSLSYINIIDRVRAEVLKLEKELISKEYSYQDEISELKKDLKEISPQDITSREKIVNSIGLKQKEYDAYKKMTTSRIEKALETLKDGIKGNRRRNEYYQTGKSQDELELAEFEYELAKKRAANASSSSAPLVSSEDLRKMEEEIRRLKEEAERAKKELEQKQKEDENKNKINPEGIGTLSENTPDFLTSVRTLKGTRALIVYLEKETISLKDSLNDAKKETQRRIITNQIEKIKNDLKLAKEILKNHLDKRLANTQKKHEEKEALQKKAAEELAKHDAERKGAAQEISGEKSSGGSKGKGGSGRKTKEVTQHEQDPKTTDVVNKFAEETKKVLK